MFKPRQRFFTKISLVISILGIFALVGLGYATDIGPIPATNWNPANLAKIKVSPAKPLTFAVFGDNRGEHPAVFASLLQEVDRAPSLAFGIHLGDMVMKAELDKYRTFFTAVRQDFHKPLLSVIGNHEFYGDEDLKFYHAIFGPDYYSFQLNNNYFMVDDADKDGMSQEQLGWLETELQKSQAAKTRLVFFHVPLCDPRGGENHHCLRPEMAAKLLALFKKYKVTYIFSAHIHDYYTGTWEGIPYTITGGAGAKLYGTDPEHAFYHYLKVTVKGDKVQVQLRRLTKQGEE